MRGDVGGTRIVLNQEAPLPVGGEKKHFEMGERFVSRRPLVPLTTIIIENSSVEHKLVGIVHDLLGQEICGAGVCDGVIDLTPDNLDGVGGDICLAEALVVRDPVCVGDDGVGLVEVGKKIKRAESAIPLVKPVFYLYKVVPEGSQKFLPKGELYVSKCVESQRGRVVGVADRRCFGSGGACRDDMRHSGIGRGHDPCCQTVTCTVRERVIQSFPSVPQPRFVLMDSVSELRSLCMVWIV